MVFNALSIYYCHRTAGGLAALIYEVNNAFGDRHSYLIPVKGEFASAIIRQCCTKHFQVFPFLAMALSDHFRLQLPDARLGIVTRADDSADPVLAAALSGKRIALRDAAARGER